MKSYCFLLWLVSSVTFASYYGEHAIGWHWYHNRIIKKATDPVVEMNFTKQLVERKLVEAVLHPTLTNVTSFLTLQNEISNRATVFANVWQQVLLRHPELNYSLAHPTNSLGAQVNLNLEQRAEEVALAQLARKSGLFFFYRKSCPYCQKFAPIVKSFAKKYNLAVIAISLDGEFLPEFLDSSVDRGQAKKFGVTVTPALFAVNPYMGKAYPISFGIISEADLRHRVLDLARNFTGGI
jgi:conjugal transfer pilus assembly protein TraF